MRRIKLNNYVMVDEEDEKMMKNSKKEKKKEKEEIEECDKSIEIDYSDFLSTEVFYDGDGILRVGIDDVYINIKLLDNEIIDAFVISWHNYSEFYLVRTIIEVLYYLNNKREWNRWFVVYPTQWGFLVTVNEYWILNDICNDVKENCDQYSVSLIDKKTFTSYITPSVLYNNLMKNYEYNPDDDILQYVLYGSINGRSAIALRRFTSKFLSHAKSVTKVYSELEDVRFSLYDAINDKYIVGEDMFIDYEEKDLINEEVKIKEQLEEWREEKDKIVDNNIHKILKSMV